jgi:hypothetical protein
MKKDPQIKITRALWATPHYFIYWSQSRQVFCEHFGSIDREWASSTIIDDLSAVDWKRI